MPQIDFVFGDSSKTVDLKDVNSVDDVKSNMTEVVMDERERLAIEAEQDHEKNN
tara:strand:- start:43 stop:204 length:162 start_codon:yes stop_codon:yes gene_type:complete